ncbi:ATP-binding protein [Thermodesulfobacteriota bacterium]
MKDIYESLRQHFNEGSMVKLRKTKELMQILKILFTPEQAEVALAIPLPAGGRISIKNLAKELGSAPEAVEDKVEALAREGKARIMTSRRDGEKYAVLWPVFPGMLEAVYADGIDNDQRRRLSRLTEKYYFEDGAWNEFASSKYPISRVIPINKSIENASNVLPFENVTRFIEESETISIIPCLCRAVAKNCDHILEADIVFGPWAEYLIKYRGARKWDKTEALQRLKECEEDGLVHLTGNTQDGSLFICNCCPCCCKPLRGLIELHNPRSFVRSNFLPRIDHEKCNLCATCKKICPMGAVSRLPGIEADQSDAMMLIQDIRCIGCGLCASHCPVHAVEMIKVRNRIPVETLTEGNNQYIKEKAW